MNNLNSFFRFGRMAALATMVSVSFSACNTDDDDDITDGGTPPPPTPALNDGHGTLVAAQTITYFTQNIPGFGEVSEEIPVNVAVGVFFNGTDYTSYVPVSSVECDGEVLEEQENGSYALSPSQNNPNGIEFSDQPQWQVNGSADIPTFSHTASRGFPAVGKINSPTTVTRSEGYTVTFESGISNADSILWIIGGEHLKTTVGNASLGAFTADELSGLQAGTSIIQVAAYNLQAKQEQGKTFYFINETVVTETVTVE